MEESTMIWLRRDKESSQAYNAFKIYLEIPNRSLQKVSEKLGKSMTILGRWSKRHDWVARAAAYDSSVVEGTRNLVVGITREGIERKVKIAERLENKALAALEELNLPRVGGRTIVEMLALANQLRNEARDSVKAEEESAQVTSIVIKKYGE